MKGHVESFYGCGVQILNSSMLRMVQGGIICLAVIFLPWAFGTTQEWSIWTANVAGYALAAVTILAACIDKRIRTGDQRTKPGPGQEGWIAPEPFQKSWVFWAAAALTAGCLAYVAISIFNAASDYDEALNLFAPRPHVRWLPHSLDRHRTWDALFNYLGLACFFWATVDWLRGSSPASPVSRLSSLVSSPPSPSPRRSFTSSPRFRLLLWVLSINGALLALEGIIQRSTNIGKLLFLVQPRVNPDALSQFGPYAYRSNAGQYLNLIWPMTVGFWLSLQRARERGELRQRRGGSSSGHLLLPCTLLMIAGPIVSASRAAAIVTGLLALVVSVVLWLAFRHAHPALRWGVPLLIVAGLAAGFLLNEKWLKARFSTVGEDFSGRERMYETGWLIQKDYAWLGTGAGTLSPVFQLYRRDPGEYWPAQLHNDWLETLITFGWAGSCLIWALLLLVTGRWFLRGGGVRANRYFVLCLWAAMAGCLLHSRWDFPFQIYSIVHLFLMLAAIMFCVERRPNKP